MTAKKEHAPRIPSLDGLRALSVGMVLVGHLEGTRNFSIDFPASHYANLGVRVFFVISGYLITTLLFIEMQKTQTISLKSFYLRRVFRIFPPFYAYLLVIAALALAGWIAVSASDVLFAATYTINFVPEKSWHVGHIWSLSVEEQFYMVWPATLFLLGKRNGLKAALAMVVAAPLCRMAWFYLAPSTQTLITESFPTVADSIAVGCLLAGLRSWLDDQPRYLRAIRSPWFWVLPIALFALNEQPFHRVRWLVGNTILNVGIAIVIDRVIRHPDDWVGRMLNSRALAYVGVLSYSLYLWQQPFLNRHSDAPWAAFPLNLLCTVVAALGSYYLIEKPALALRRRLAI